jgi:hypothetical protein
VSTEKIIEMVATSADFLGASAEHTAATIQAKLRQDGSYVSPMTYQPELGYVFSLHIPEHDEEPEPLVWESGESEDADETSEEAQQADASAAALRQIDPVDVVSRCLEQISGMADPDANPLVHLAEAWVAEQPWDWSRPQISPHVAEGIGRWMAIRLARVMEQRLACLTSEQAF